MAHDLARSLTSKSNRVATEDGNNQDVDPEKAVGTGAEAQESEKDPNQNGNVEDTDPFLVQWEEGDKQNPRNWSMRRKWCLVAFLSWITFLTPLASSIFAPGVPDVQAEFNDYDTVTATFVVSVFVLGFAFGPLVIAPMSEIYGRNPVYHTCNVLFVLFTIGCATSTDMGMLIAFRFTSGFAGVAIVTCGAGSIADMMPAEWRGRAISIWSMGPMLGPTIGPVVAGFVIKALGWRWSFWIVVIASGVTTLAAFFVLRETYSPVILRQKAAKLRKETGDERWHYTTERAVGETRTPKQIFLMSLIRPLRMLFLQPIVTVCAIYIATLYGLMYILFTTFTFVYEGQYGFGSVGAGLSFISSGIGMLTGLAIVGNLSDRLYHRALAADRARSETRLHWVMVGPGSILVPVGLFIYGWTAYYKVHWIAPMIGSAVMSVGTIIITMCVQTYLVDSFPTNAASVSAANTVLRSILGALLPLCGLNLYDAIGLGWGNSLLGFIALALAPVPVCLGLFGERLRTNPKYAIQL
ncbi:major facilitator superfamily domain-containing protein [Mycena maculata]|uniref:Major facilitator superfamily domain-containing protein n=1 Tax=Mycena maculata TaxID=230809 RepID=A0AAD7IXU0_9AGAR|nr:major facilitator superfamily domain-containing protein [Mycena maculata]